jgi:chromosome segregation ATPase
MTLVDWAQLATIIGLAFGWLRESRKQRVELPVLKAQEKNTLAQEKKTIVEAAETTVGVLLKTLSFLEAERDEFESRITELEEHRAARTKELAELHAHNQILSAGVQELREQSARDIKETIELREQVTLLTQKYERQKRVNEKLVKALNDAGIPLPDMNGDMSDSVQALKMMGNKK